MPSTQGFRGYLGVALQTTPGTLSGASSAHWLPFVSESIVEDAPRIDSAEIRLSPDEGYSHQGMRTLAGDIVLEPTPFTMAVISYLTLGAIATTSNAAYNLHTITGDSTGWHAKFPLPVFSLLIGRDVGSAVYVKDCQANNLSLDIANGELMKATLSVVGGEGIGAVDQVSVVSYGEGGEYHWPWNVCSLQILGSAPTDIKQGTLAIANNLEQVPTIDGNTYPARAKRAGFRRITFNGEVALEHMDYYNALRSNTKSAFTLNMKTDSTHFMTLTHDSLHIEAHPRNIGGPGAVNASLAMRGDGDSLSLIAKTGVVLRVGSGSIS